MVLYMGCMFYLVYCMFDFPACMDAIWLILVIIAPYTFWEWLAIYFHCGNYLGPNIICQLAFIHHLKKRKHHLEVQDT